MNHETILIGVTDAAQLLGTIPSRVTRFARRGLLPCVKLPNGELRFSPDDLKKWALEHRQPVALSTDETPDGLPAEIQALIDGADDE